MWKIPLPNMITANDLDVVIEGWERKFEHLSQCLREMQLDSEKANSTMSNMVRDGRAREDMQERRIKEMHAGLTQFLERCDPAHLTAPRSVDAPAASTPFTPTGVPSRLRHDFNFESPVNQATPTDSTSNGDPRNTHPRNIDQRNTHPRDIDPRNRDHHDASNDIDARNADPRNIRSAQHTIRATKITTTLEIVAGTIDLMNDQRMRTTEEIVVTRSATHITVV